MCAAIAPIKTSSSLKSFIEPSVLRSVTLEIAAPKKTQENVKVKKEGRVVLNRVMSVAVLSFIVIKLPFLQLI
jgi:hypothetical protein